MILRMPSCLTARTVKIPLKWLNGGRQLGKYNGSTVFLIGGVKLTCPLLRYIPQMKLRAVEEAPNGLNASLPELAPMPALPPIPTLPLIPPSLRQAPFRQAPTTATPLPVS